MVTWIHVWFLIVFRAKIWNIFGISKISSLYPNIFLPFIVEEMNATITMASCCIYHRNLLIDIGDIPFGFGQHDAFAAYVLSRHGCIIIYIDGKQGMTHMNAEMVHWSNEALDIIENSDHGLFSLCGIFQLDIVGVHIHLLRAHESLPLQYSSGIFLKKTNVVHTSYTRGWARKRRLFFRFNSSS